MLTTYLGGWKGSIGENVMKLSKHCPNLSSSEEGCPLTDKRRGKIRGLIENGSFQIVSKSTIEKYVRVFGSKLWTNLARTITATNLRVVWERKTMVISNML